MSTMPQRRMAAILATHVVDYGRLMGDDEVETLAGLTAYCDAIAPILAEHGGRIVKEVGGGLVLEFAKAFSAARAALAMQRVATGRNIATEPERRLQFRIGIHLGDVIGDGLDVSGPGVATALRLVELAEPGGISLSDPVRKRIDRDLQTLLDTHDAIVIDDHPAPLRVFMLMADTPPPPVSGTPAPSLPAPSPSSIGPRLRFKAADRAPPHSGLPLLWGLSLKAAAVALIAAIAVAVSGIHHPPIVIATSWVLIAAGVVQLASLVGARLIRRPQRA